MYEEGVLIYGIPRVSKNYTSIKLVLEENFVQNETWIKVVIALPLIIYDI